MIFGSLTFTSNDVVSRRCPPEVFRLISSRQALTSFLPRQWRQILSCRILPSGKRSGGNLECTAIGLKSEVPMFVFDPI
jgi:hypothetical protein